jgi:hypothetical protein
VSGVNFPQICLLTPQHINPNLRGFVASFKFRIDVLSSGFSYVEVKRDLKHQNLKQFGKILFIIDIRDGYVPDGCNSAKYKMRIYPHKTLHYLEYLQ